MLVLPVWLTHSPLCSARVTWILTACDHVKHLSAFFIEANQKIWEKIHKSQSTSKLCNYVSLGGICWKQYSNFIFAWETCVKHKVLVSYFRLITCFKSWCFFQLYLLLVISLSFRKLVGSYFPFLMYAAVTGSWVNLTVLDPLSLLFVFEHK